MREGNLLYVIAKTIIFVIAMLVAACGTLLFLISSFAGLAAWSDYYDRGCPDANQ